MTSTSPLLIRVITWLPVGGIERRLVAVVPRLRDLGWRVRVICIREEGPLAADLRDQGVPVEVIPFRSRMSPPAISRLVASFRHHGAAVVHSHMYRSNIPCSIAGRLARVPVVLGQVHNVDSWDNGRQVLVDRLVSRLRTATLAVSRAVQQDVMRRLGLPEERVPILYNGIDTEAFRPDAESGEGLRREFGIAPDRLVLLVPARLHRQKNPFGVLEAMQRLLAGLPAGREKPLLLFAGGGGLATEVAGRVTALGLQDCVRLLGSRDDMAALYNAADVVVLSSFREGFSNAVVEGLACGRPVIASDVGGNREAIADSTVGWIHDSGDTGALAAQMGSAIGLGREGLARMAPACRDRAMHFSMDSMILKTDRLYRSHLEARTGAR